MTKVIRIDGMSCMHCVKRVNTALEQLDGVTSVDVNLELNQATINSGDTIFDAVIKNALDDVGYDVLSIEVLI